jgi:hypothetical protein
MGVSRLKDKDKPAAKKGSSKKKGEEKVFVGRIESRDLDIHYPPGIEIVRYKYTKRSEKDREALRDKFDSSVRSAFLKDIAAKQEKALRTAGIDDEGIERMQQGLCPVGYQVHHKKSIDDNGTNDFSNLVLIDNEPYHKGITNEQNRLCGDLKAGESKMVDFPIPSGFVYPATPS